MCVLPVAVNIGLALLDGVVEEHELLAIADHQRRRRILELRLGELLQPIDGLPVGLLRFLHIVNRCGSEDDIAELAFVRLALHDPHERSQAGEEDQRGSDLPVARPRPPPLLFQRALDARPEHFVRPRGAQIPRGV